MGRRIAAAAAASALGLAASGTFTGHRQYAYYGYVKVRAVVGRWTS